MRKLLILSMILALITACEKKYDPSDGMLENSTSLATDGTKLVGQHFNLNLIGTKEKTMDDDIAAGHVIFVNLEGVTEIGLVEGDDYAVLDKNGTDEDGALFQLPDPGFEPYVTELPFGFDTETDYSVYARPLGKPMTGAEITLMAELSDYGWEILDKHGERIWSNIIDNFDLISLTWGEFIPNPVTFERTKGKQTFQNVTAELLSVVYEIIVTYDTGLEDDPNTVEDESVAEVVLHVRIPIFNEMLEGEYWKYDNNGLKLLQIRFYPFGTDVTYDDLENGWGPSPE